MDEVLKLDAEQIAGLTFDCSCGKKHSVSIDKILIGSNMAGEVAKTAKSYHGRAFLVADSNTYAALGGKVESTLKEEGVDYNAFVFHTETNLVPDESAVGRLLVEMEPDSKIIVAVGSGSINDLCRELSCKTHIPYLIAATAPSMDGYASVVSPLIIDHFKISLPAVYASAIIADTSVMKDAPMELIHAGFGDIIGKYNALTEWVLAREVNGEYYCETTVRLVESAMQKCVENAAGIIKRDEKAIRYVAEALILSGIAIGLVGNTRPASGAEHHLSHYWEMDALRNNRPHPLHGNAVGVGTVVMTSVYELLQDRIPKACKPVKPEFISSLLRSIGAKDNPKDLGIGRELFRESVIHAKEVRPRYTILQYAADLGELEKIADILTKRFYD